MYAISYGKDAELASTAVTNFDKRSCGLNFEITAILFDRNFATEVETMHSKGI